MKQLIILSALLAIVSAQYYCNTYPTTASPNYWSCQTAFNNGYIYTRSSTSKIKFVKFVTKFINLRLLEAMYQWRTHIQVYCPSKQCLSCSFRNWNPKDRNYLISNWSRWSNYMGQSITIPIHCIYLSIFHPKCCYCCWLFLHQVWK